MRLDNSPHVKHLLTDPLLYKSACLRFVALNDDSSRNQPPPTISSPYYYLVQKESGSNSPRVPCEIHRASLTPPLNDTSLPSVPLETETSLRPRQDSPSRSNEIRTETKSLQVFASSSSRSVLSPMVNQTSLDPPKNSFSNTRDTELYPNIRVDHETAMVTSSPVFQLSETQAGLDSCSTPSTADPPSNTKNPLTSGNQSSTQVFRSLGRDLQLT